MQRRPHRSDSTEFKLSVVQAYLNGEGGLKAFAQAIRDLPPAAYQVVRKFGLAEFLCCSMLGRVDS